ncbi:MAG: hypothetical protein WCS65_08965 [Verrucomicrobiae bacterium]
MDISLITSQSLLHLLSLAEKKEELIQIIAEVDAEITRTLKGGAVSVVEVFEMPASQPAIAKPAPVAGQPVAAAQAPAKAGRPGGLKSRVLALLDAAGPRGLRVKEIAEKLGASSSNISVWFSTTGKKLTTKIEPGRYAAKAGAGVKPDQETAPAKPGKSLKQGKMSAEGRAKIAALMKARWAARRAGKAAAPIAAAKPAQLAAPAKAAKASKKSKMSAEGRARISAATTARWAVRRAGKAAAPIAAAKPAQVAAPAKAAKASKKSKISAEGRARISAATTARWAARRAAKTSAVSRPTKTTKTYKLL